MIAAENGNTRVVSGLLICSILIGTLGLAAPPSAAQGSCREGVQESGARYRICMPPEGVWNGDLVVYAHGYVPPENPIALPEYQLMLKDGTTMPQTLTQLGFAFATTSYSTNGLAVKEGLDDLVALVEIFSREEETPTHTYLVGASEGGLITALAVEQHPGTFDGGLAACGPTGDFRRQIDYWGDVRVLFDVFFPGVLPRLEPAGDPLAPLIPRSVINRWYYCGDPGRNLHYPCVDDPEESYENRVRKALLDHPERTEQLLRAAHVPAHPDDRQANVEALVQLLWYNVFATNDAIAKLGGQPYDNGLRWFYGSDHDWELNQSVERFNPSPVAIAEIESAYQTSAEPNVPIVTLHTLRDPIVPAWHETIYRSGIRRNEAQGIQASVFTSRYGHCRFTVEQILFGFNVLARRVSGRELWDLRLPFASAP